MKSFLLVLAISSLALAVGGAGCVNPRNRSPVDEDTVEVLPLSRDLQFDDIPVPDGFLHDETNSYTYEIDNFRNCELFYSGKSRTEAVLNFYKEQMPISNWKFESRIGRYRKTLTFTKGSEVCTVDVEKDAGKTFVTIRVVNRDAP